MGNIFQFFVNRFFNSRYKKRIAQYIALLCEDNAKILDLGCGDGSMALLIRKVNPTLEIVGVDIRKAARPKIDMIQYDGKKIPYPDDHFDIVMAIDVLHHTTDIKGMLAEMKRVSRRSIIIKDCQTHSWFSRLLVCSGDFISNAPFGVKCEYNYPSANEWADHFAQLGMATTIVPSQLDYGFFWINERCNPIFKLTKC